MSNRDSEFGETYGLTNHKISDGQDWTLDDTIRRGFIRKVYGILSAQLMLTFGKNTRAISSAFGFRFWSSFVTGRQADRQADRLHRDRLFGHGKHALSCQTWSAVS